MSNIKPFNNQFLASHFTKFGDLPVYEMDEFVFFRCVDFKEDFYGKTASELFSGNLRTCTGRYSKLFPDQKISYWADHPATARAEIKKHGAGNNILTFWAYDDGTSTFPSLPDQNPLIIIDGRKCGIQFLIDKAEADVPLNSEENDFLQLLLSFKPDCLAYDSHARAGGENFIFFEKGFKKLAMRELTLRFGRNSGGNHNTIYCAVSSDYSPIIENYGKMFEPKARVLMNEAYLQTEEYATRKMFLEASSQKYIRWYNGGNS